MARKLSEHQKQALFITAMRQYACGIVDFKIPEKFRPFFEKLLFAIPNGGERKLLEAHRLVNEGVVSGVCDLFLSIPFNGHCGLYLEFKKSSKDKPKPEQLEFMDLVEELGYKTAVVWEVEMAIEAVENYFQG